jgi:hypothetical protein
MTSDDLTTDTAPGPLGQSLASLRGAMAGVQAPRGVEKELMAAFAKQFPPRRWYHALSARQWGLAGGAAGIAGIACVAMLALVLPQVAPPGATPGVALDRILADDGPAFIALQPRERIEQEANPQMLEADLPRTALAALGVPVNPEEAGESVRAEMLVGADGAPLALRLMLP